VELPERDEYVARWSALHGGYRPGKRSLAGGWLTLAYRVARPCAAARASPDAVTVLGLVLAGAAVAPAAAGGWWLVLAAALVGLAGLMDSVDGAVALLTERATRWGYLLDSATDRVADVLFVLTLWVASGGTSDGAPTSPALRLTVAVLAGALMFLHEYVRARAIAAGMRDIGVVTVWERPTRVVVTAMFLVAGAVRSDRLWPTLGLLVWAGLGVLGLMQLALVVRRRLRALDDGTVPP
jgi:CDP-diacylglycerol--glycerol-3-phosphate 3-phosphatidyltransferase